jgi:hypothetical protein
MAGDTLHIYSDYTNRKEYTILNADDQILTTE